MDLPCLPGPIEKCHPLCIDGASDAKVSSTERAREF